MAAHQSWISYFSNLVKQYGGINLAQGIPGFQPPEDLQAALQKHATKEVHQYAPGTGNHQLREHIFGIYKGKISPENHALMVTNGGTEAIHLLYMSFHRDKSKLKAAAFSPVYESYLHLPRIHGDEFRSLEMDNKDGNLPMRLRHFFETWQPDVFFANTPGNPYGNSLDKASFDTLIELSKTYRCHLLIDAVYDKLYFNKAPYYPFSDFHDYVYYINSFSKLYSITGWRIGYFFCHPGRFDAIRDIHDYTGLSTPSVLQAALADFMETSPQKSTYVNETRDKIRGNFHAGSKILKSAGFTIPPADGGYFIWTQLPEGCPDSVTFAKSLYEKHKTAVIPGEHFGKAYQDYIRINIARPQEELLAGLKNVSLHAKSGQ
ncbi:MAG: pyridoxal phosphate-dependent aminotransferase [Bacteroidales bacterium]